MKRAIYDQAERLRLVAACQRADHVSMLARHDWQELHARRGHEDWQDARRRRVVKKREARRAHRALEAFDKRERQARIGVALAALDLGACGHALTVRE